MVERVKRRSTGDKLLVAAALVVVQPPAGLTRAAESGRRPSGVRAGVRTATPVGAFAEAFARTTPAARGVHAAASRPMAFMAAQTTQYLTPAREQVANDYVPSLPARVIRVGGQPAAALLARGHHMWQINSGPAPLADQSLAGQRGPGVYFERLLIFDRRPGTIVRVI